MGKEEENMEEISISPAFSDPSDHITESEILDQTLVYLDDLMNRDDLMKDKEVTSPWSYSTMSDDSMGDTWCFDNDSDISDMIAPVDRDLNKVITEVCHGYLFPEDLETEADGFEETDKPLQDTDPANTLEVPEPSKQVEVPEPTKNPDVPEPPQMLEVTESPKTLEVPEPPNRLEVTESTKTLKVTELTKILEVPESPKTLEVTEPTMILELAELPMQVEAPEPTKNLEVSEPHQTLEVTEPFNTMEVPESPKNLEVSEPHQTLEVNESTETLEVPESPKTLEVTEPHQTLEVTESTKTLEEEENMEEISISPAFSDPSDHITESEILDQTLAYLDDLMNRDDLMKDKEVTSPWSYSTMSDDSMGDTWCFDNDSDISDMIAPVDRISTGDY
ncbi:Paternally-expressed 3 protein [Dissostichus eleginoides]|uniref:Paternally-expressed 3 protein n=1 Tax=Dissostichus eleginoides TaxID=100907 RepID=A0AAD9ETJ8_DISEL|nr:Paternally-expressed 3 protein [Dissostichus eleginoides]